MMQSTRVVLALLALVTLTVSWNLDYHDRIDGPSWWQTQGLCVRTTSSPINIISPQFTTRLDPFNLIAGGTGKCRIQNNLSRRFICKPIAGTDDKISFVADMPSQIDTDPRPQVIHSTITEIEFRHPSSHTFNYGHYAAELIVRIADPTPNDGIDNSYSLHFLFRESDSPRADASVFNWFEAILDRKVGNYGVWPYSNNPATVLLRCAATNNWPRNVGDLRSATSATGAWSPAINGGAIPADPCLDANVDFEYNLRDLIGPNEHYYYYNGQDDLPPCTTLRRTIVFKKLLEVTPKQLQKLNDYSNVRSSYYNIWSSYRGVERDLGNAEAAAKLNKMTWTSGNHMDRPHFLRFAPFDPAGVPTYTDNEVNGDYYRYPRISTVEDTLLPRPDVTIERPSSGAVLSPPTRPLNGRIVWSSDPEEVGATTSNVHINQRGMMLIKNNA
jgi:hypothetical protein